MSHGSGLPDLVVFHPDGAAARATIERLSRAGVDGGAIELMGRVEVATAGRHGDRQVDLGSTLALGGRVVRGVLLGAPPGALFGAVVIALATQPTWQVVLAGAGGGAMFGAAVGILTALLAAPTMASSWERTFAPLVPGRVAVGIRVTDRRGQRRAMRALAGAPPGSVLEVDDLDSFPDEPLDPHALDE
jgi:hypothetical protein